MTDYVKDPHTAIFSGPTGCGKTQKVLDLLEGPYKHHFDNIVILCPTLRWNKTYLERSWVWKDDYVFLFEPSGDLLNLIEKLGKHLANEETLFIIDDCIAESELDKARGVLLRLAVSGRHKKHSLWMLTQRYTKVPLTVRDQLKQLFVWYPKNRGNFEIINTENDVIDVKDLSGIKKQLRDGVHRYLFIRIAEPRSYEIFF